MKTHKDKVSEKALINLSDLAYEPGAGEIIDLITLSATLSALESLESISILTMQWDSFGRYGRTGDDREYIDMRRYNAAIERMECCPSCISRGVLETWTENEQIYDGYLLFSQQDADVFDGQGNLKQRLFFCFGNFRDQSDEGQLSFARSIVAVLEQPFTVEWSGRLDERICILPHARTGRTLPPDEKSLPEDLGKEIKPGLCIYPPIKHFPIGTGACAAVHA
jgi:hypothetical protein